MVTLALDSVVDDQVVPVVPAAAAQLAVRVLLCCRLVLFVDHEWRVMVCGNNFFNQFAHINWCSLSFRELGTTKNKVRT